MLAKEKSIDKTSAVNGGELGFFTADQMVPAFSKAAFALKKPGEISPIVHTQYGYHIIQLIAKKPAQVRTFEQVKPQIEQMLAQQDAKADFEKLIDELKAKTKIDIKVQ
jgi:parvulin-like peptidyl-prolyl isomerase